VRGKEVGKGYRRVNTVQILSVHTCMEKRNLLKLFHEWGEGRIKENDGGDEFKYDVRTFVNATMYPQHNIKKMKQHY
jgi:hypothetical protein